jgi:hypothetical protein
MRTSRLPSPRRYNRQFVRQLPLVPWITAAYLVAEPRPCPACLRAAGRYDVAELPVMPVAACLKKRGCGCWFAAVPPAAEARIAGVGETSGARLLLATGSATQAHGAQQAGAVATQPGETPHQAPAASDDGRETERRGTDALCA